MSGAVVIRSSDVRDIRNVILGIASLWLLFQPPLHGLIQNLAKRTQIWYKRRQFLCRYKSFLQDISSPLSERRMLLLCHGREHGVPIFDFMMNGEEQPPRVEDYDVVCIDKDVRTKPHVVEDVNYYTLGTICYQYDWIVLFNCKCHTETVNTNPRLVANLRRLLKDDGWLIVTQPQATSNTWMSKLKTLFDEQTDAPIGIGFEKLPEYDNDSCCSFVPHQGVHFNTNARRYRKKLHCIENEDGDDAETIECKMDEAARTCGHMSQDISNSKEPDQMVCAMQAILNVLEEVRDRLPAQRETVSQNV